MNRTALHLTLIAAAFGGSTAAMADTSPFFGRWINSEDKPHYSSKGILYKTVDIAPCGKDFCGVSVDEKGGCGETLFRFLTIHANEQILQGHGKWGSTKLKVQIEQSKDEKDQNTLLIGLGDNKFDFESREGSTPIYSGTYKSIGTAKCIADVTS